MVTPDSTYIHTTELFETSKETIGVFLIPINNKLYTVLRNYSLIYPNHKVLTVLNGLRWHHPATMGLSWKFIHVLLA